MKNWYGLSIVLLLFFGCNSNTGPEEVFAFDVSGTVTLYTDTGLSLQDKSGVRVSTGGSTAMTASDGSWTLTGVSINGIYTILLSKKGFMTVGVPNIQYGYNGLQDYFVGNVSIPQRPNVHVTQLKITGPDTNKYFHIQGTLSSADSLSRSVGIIFDKMTIAIPNGPFDSSTVVEYVYGVETSLQPDSTSFAMNQIFNDDTKSGYGILTGSTLYARAYALPRTSYSPTYDRVSFKYDIFNSSIIFSNMDSLIVP
jgi:hypothetical protein